MHLKNIALSFLATLTLVTGAHAQGALGKSTANGEASVAQEASAFGFTHGSFVAAPIPIKNPTLGSGFALGAGYLFAMDDVSDDSYLGLGGFKTDNGSFGYGISGDIAWDENRWNLALTLGEVSLNYDYSLFGGDGPKIPLEQEGRLVNFTLKYGLTDAMRLGLNTAYVETALGLNSSDNLPAIFERDADLKIWRIGPMFEIDTRNDSTYPTAGSHLSINSNYNIVESKIFERTYTKSIAKLDNYTSVNDSLVVASQATICNASEGAPFFDQCGLGTVDAFRGFAFGEVLNNSLVSVQAEVRGVVTDRLGYVVFAGLGNVGPDFSDMKSKNIRSSGGVGLRFRLSQKFPLDFSMDAARADTGEDTYYIYVGQRF
ncbi:BamA/TamA family outer membrane protein [Falsihalocynthiibacter sp. BN13B15]|uniref:BamA/TamA family outer membrane protein n=1 Tax=Falsihalocynthiibacter sp. BN13B15 TaxID=3240871 RepID=UPI00350F0CE8